MLFTISPIEGEIDLTDTIKPEEVAISKALVMIESERYARPEYGSLGEPSFLSPKPA